MSPPKSTKSMRKLLEKGFKIRCFEEKLLNLSQNKKISGTVHTCIGQELIPVVLSSLLDKKDYIFSNHRSHGHFLAKFENSYEELALEILGKKNGVCGGVGGSQHLNKENFYSSGV